MPALPTKTSSCPKALTAAATAFWLAAGLVTSPFTATTVRRSWSARSLSMCSAERSRTTTRAPSCTNRSTTARPSPEAPPVTMAVCPSSHPMAPLSFLGRGVAPAAGSRELAGLPAGVVYEAPAVAVLDPEAGRRAGIERDHPVVGVAAEGAGQLDPLRLDQVVAPADVVDVVELDHEV